MKFTPDDDEQPIYTPLRFAIGVVNLISSSSASFFAALTHSILHLAKRAEVFRRALAHWLALVMNRCQIGKFK